MNIGDRPRGWAENPRFSLDMMSAGQRYTVVLTAALAVALLTLGTPDGSRRPAAAAGLGPSPAAVSAGLVPPTTALTALPSAPDVPLPTAPDTSSPFTSATTTASVETTSTTSTSSTTTTTTTPPLLPSLPVPLP